MIRSHLQSLISETVAALVTAGKLPAAEYEPVEIADPRSPEHGDYASNFALVNSKKAGMNPRALGEALAVALVAHPDFEAVEVAGPGFLNLRLKPEAISRYVADVLAKGADLSHSPCDLPRKINVEFVSVNPNGPITVASGRGAAFGSALCRVLKAVGHEVHREYYINDGVNSTQMRLFAESVRSYVEGTPFPEKGYKGDYVQAVAEAIKQDAGRESRTPLLSWYQARSQQLMLGRQRADLATFGVEFDTWFSEQSLHDAGLVDRCIDELVAKGVADDEPYRTVLNMGKKGEVLEVNKEEQPVETDDGPNEEAEGESPASGHTPPSATGAEDPSLEGTDPRPSSDPSTVNPQPTTPKTLWLRSTKFADDMDRVIRRKDGRLTYIASDVAYHKDKFNRPENADKLITVLGPDHHGYINRLRAVVAALLEQGDAEGESRIANRESPSGSKSLIANRQSRSESESRAGNPPATTNAPLEGPDADIYRTPEERDACHAALSEAEKKLEVVIFQLVRFLKDGKQAPMRKRDGNIYALIDLIDELGKTMAPNGDPQEQQRVGRDIARFFYLTRSHDTNIDFDLDLATKQSDENPVFYAQYAHARICSVERKAREAGLGSGVSGLGDGTGDRDAGRGTRDAGADAGDRDAGRGTRDAGADAGDRDAGRGTRDAGDGTGDRDAGHGARDAGADAGARKSEIGNPDTLYPKPYTLDPNPAPYQLLTHPKELALIKKIVDLAWEVRRCAEDYGVHRLTTYAVELARTYHAFYDNCRVIQPENPELSQARLTLCAATRMALRSTFDLLGISAPERMERAASE